MKYYALMPDLNDKTALLTHGPNLVSPFNNWISPDPQSIPVPEPLQLKVRRDGRLLPFYDNPIPVMRDDILAIIKKAGVSNIDDYSATITNPFDGKIYSNYLAIKIIGAIEAVDEELSESDELDESGADLGGKFYDEIIIDEAKANGALLFRLKEFLPYIVIAESIREAILTKGDPQDFYFKPLFEEDE